MGTHRGVGILVLTSKPLAGYVLPQRQTATAAWVCFGSRGIQDVFIHGPYATALREPACLSAVLSDEQQFLASLAGATQEDAAGAAAVSLTRLLITKLLPQGSTRDGDRSLRHNRAPQPAANSLQRLQQKQQKQQQQMYECQPVPLPRWLASSPGFSRLRDSQQESGTRISACAVASDCRAALGFCNGVLLLVPLPAREREEKLKEQEAAAAALSRESCSPSSQHMSSPQQAVWVLQGHDAEITDVSVAPRSLLASAGLTGCVLIHVLPACSSSSNSSSASSKKRGSGKTPAAGAAEAGGFVAVGPTLSLQYTHPVLSVSLSPDCSLSHFPAAAALLSDAQAARASLQGCAAAVRGGTVASFPGGPSFSRLRQFHASTSAPASSLHQREGGLRSVCAVGCMNGSLLLHTRGFYAERDVLLQQGDAPICCCRWRGSLLAWGTTSGSVHVFHVSSKQKVCCLQRPLGTAAAAGTAAASETAAPPRSASLLQWVQDDLLAVAWETEVQLLRIVSSEDPQPLTGVDAAGATASAFRCGHVISTVDLKGSSVRGVFPSPELPSALQPALCLLKLERAAASAVAGGSCAVVASKDSAEEAVVWLLLVSCGRGCVVSHQRLRLPFSAAPSRQRVVAEPDRAEKREDAERGSHTSKYADFLVAPMAEGGGCILCCGADVFALRPRDAQDKVQWLLQQQPLTLNVELALSTAMLVSDEFATATSLQAVRLLLQQQQREAAAALLPRLVLQRDADWMDLLCLFAEHKALAPFACQLVAAAAAEGAPASTAEGSRAATTAGECAAARRTAFQPPVALYLELLQLLLRDASADLRERFRRERIQEQSEGSMQLQEQSARPPLQGDGAAEAAAFLRCLAAFPPLPAAASVELLQCLLQLPLLCRLSQWGVDAASQETPQQAHARLLRRLQQREQRRPLQEPHGTHEGGSVWDSPLYEPLLRACAVLAHRLRLFCCSAHALLLLQSPRAAVYIHRVLMSPKDAISPCVSEPQGAAIAAEADKRSVTAPSNEFEEENNRILPTPESAAAALAAAVPSMSLQLLQLQAADALTLLCLRPHPAKPWLCEANSARDAGESDNSCSSSSGFRHRSKNPGRGALVFPPEDVVPHLLCAQALLHLYLKAAYSACPAAVACLSLLQVRLLPLCQSGGKNAAHDRAPALSSLHLHVSKGGAAAKDRAAKRASTTEALNPVSSSDSSSTCRSHLAPRALRSAEAAAAAPGDRRAATGRRLASCCVICNKPLAAAPGQRTEFWLLPQGGAAAATWGGESSAPTISASTTPRATTPRNATAGAADTRAAAGWVSQLRTKTATGEISIPGEALVSDDDLRRAEEQGRLAPCGELGRRARTRSPAAPHNTQQANKKNGSRGGALQCTPATAGGVACADNSGYGGSRGHACSPERPKGMWAHTAKRPPNCCPVKAQKAAPDADIVQSMTPTIEEQHAQENSVLHRQEPTLRRVASVTTDAVGTSEKAKKKADDGARTRDHEVKSLALYRLSYIGDCGGSEVSMHRE
ncbi:uncharacterized protein LOC34621706 [Cyclospora cayetanensis]|uniref:Uncharacterized protein LOC34621706 n=1 Tax=Cyclospora cayetanensis TaxID=88456 RepID=A0A6P6RVN0_9EIME|nr:uncharacterized protein LOC34621706 [Cyclospora cayetanensis]